MTPTKTLADLIEEAKADRLRKIAQKMHEAELEEQRQVESFNEVMQRCLPNVYPLLDERRIIKKLNGQHALAFTYRTTHGEIILCDGGMRLTYDGHTSQISWTVNSQQLFNNLRETYFLLALAGMPEDAEYGD